MVFTNSTDTQSSTFWLSRAKYFFSSSIILDLCKKGWGSLGLDVAGYYMAIVAL